MTMQTTHTHPTSPQAPVVLLTGFAPFEHETRNPSWDAVAALDGERVEGHRIVARCLPVEFGASLRQLYDAMDELQPALVVCVGLAGGRAQVSLERVAINIDDARIPDNIGAQPVDAALPDRDALIDSGQVERMIDPHFG